MNITPRRPAYGTTLLDLLFFIAACAFIAGIFFSIRRYPVSGLSFQTFEPLLWALVPFACFVFLLIAGMMSQPSTAAKQPAHSDKLEKPDSDA
jgi:hypothetical protein